MQDALPVTRPNTPLLDTVTTPQDLRQLAPEQLRQVADELRLFLLYSVGQSGGHFGANLGVVEITTALHYLYNTPEDQLVWDVGHQAYPHKILTGRREQLVSIRSEGGLTAFPERSESIYDTFGVGHSSTSISAAVGMALAIKHQGRNERVVCVIGDGAMTGGMAFEAMNDAAHTNADVLVILNDNDMSISNATGGFSQHLAALWHSGYQIDIDENAQPQIRPRPHMDFTNRRHAPAIEDNLFKSIGFNYFGPFDGHNLSELLRVIERAKRLKSPILVHIYTTKGKGFLPAEQDPIGYHAIGKRQPAKSSSSFDSAKPSKKYSQVFGEFLCDQAAQDNTLMAITPAMCEGSGMVEFAARYPSQFYDVAIAEQHAVTLAAGMATQGVKPVVAIYSTFLQRGYDQVIHDVALQNLDVTFAIDRAGLVGEDGATHAGVFDYAFLRCLPNLVIMAPQDENECYQMLCAAYDYKGVATVRYPRGTGIGAPITKPAQPLSIGQAEWVIRQLPSQTTSKAVVIMAFGIMTHNAKLASDYFTRLDSDIKVDVINMRFIKPLDVDVITQCLADYEVVITLEDHVVAGGAGSAVNEAIVANQHHSGREGVPRIINMGIPDRFVEHASREQQLQACGLDAPSIIAAIEGIFSP